MTDFCLTKDELFSIFYIKINNGNTFKQIIQMGIKYYRPVGLFSYFYPCNNHKEFRKKNDCTIIVTDD